MLQPLRYTPRMAINAEFTLGGNQQGARRVHDTPFRILLLADCMGDKPPTAALGQRTVGRLDLDRFDQLLARLAPELDLGEHGRMTFRALDDFHPDSLCRLSPVLARLLETHRALGDPRQAGQLLAGRSENRDDSPAESSTVVSDLERLLGGRVQTADQRSDSKLGRYLADLVTPHLVDTRSAEPYRQATEAALAEQLRALLHEPALQQLEACWRGLWWLVTQLPAEQIEIELLPLSRDELLADVAEAGAEVNRSALFTQLFRNPQAGDWSVIAALYDFGPTHAEIQALAALAALAEAGRATLLGGAAPALAGCDSPESLAEPDRWRELEPAIQTRWQALRRSQVAARVALAVPRLLLRAPFEPRNQPIESFTFSERVSGDSELLWTTAALGLTAALGQMFQNEEWEMDAAHPAALEDLASFSIQQDGETMLRPATEAVLSDQAIRALAQAGLTPVVGSRRGIEVIMPGCVSLTGQALTGRWNA